MTEVICLTSNSRQRAHSSDSSALQKKMVLFIDLFGKGLTQGIDHIRILSIGLELACNGG